MAIGSARREACPRSPNPATPLPGKRVTWGRPAAIELTTARPLCQEGRAQITGGAVLLWAKPGSDPMVLATRFSPS